VKFSLHLKVFGVREGLRDIKRHSAQAKYQTGGEHNQTWLKRRLDCVDLVLSVTILNTFILMRSLDYTLHTSPAAISGGTHNPTQPPTKPSQTIR